MGELADSRRRVSAGFNPADPASWPVVMTTDEVALVDRCEEMSPRQGRRRVKAHVEAGRLVPIHGAPVEGEMRVSLSWRFSKRDVMVFAGVDPTPAGRVVSRIGRAS